MASAKESVREIWLEEIPGRLPTWKNDRKAGGGRTVTSVAAEFGINKSVISRAWKAFQTTGTAVRKVGGSRPRTTTAGDGRYILLQAKKRRTAVSKRHCSATLYSNGATSVVV
ncbi:transposable element Tcb2 transposase [Trichonephila clavipes]|nr:transposable element Tcb2 transposase [Trichonephila clavipes]